jgi:hypothetical protein
MWHIQARVSEKRTQAPTIADAINLNVSRFFMVLVCGGVIAL